MLRPAQEVREGGDREARAPEGGTTVFMKDAGQQSYLGGGGGLEGGGLGGGRGVVKYPFAKGFQAETLSSAAKGEGEAGRGLGAPNLSICQRRRGGFVKAAGQGVGCLVVRGLEAGGSH